MNSVLTYLPSQLYTTSQQLQMEPSSLEFAELFQNPYIYVTVVYVLPFILIKNIHSCIKNPIHTLVFIKTTINGIHILYQSKHLTRENSVVGKLY